MMKWLIALTGLLMACPIARAQWAGSGYSQTFTCRSQTCSDSVTVNSIGNPSQYGIYWIAATAICCNQGYPTFIPLSSVQCNGSGKLSDPKFRERLGELAKADNIMAAGCDGTYSPLEIALKLNTARPNDSLFNPGRESLWQGGE